MAVAAGEDSGDRARQNWISTLPLPLTSVETLNKSLDLSELRFPLLSNGMLMLTS